MILDNVDNKILKSLNQGDLHPSEISRRICIPRTTINYRLKRLEKLNRAKSKIHGRKTVWSLDFKNQNNTSFLEIFEKDNFYNAYLEIFNIPPKSIVLSVQGVLAGQNEMINLPRPLILKIHKFFKRNNIVFKSISNIKILDTVDSLDKEYIKSHYGRGGGIRLLKDSSFLGAGEMLVSSAFVIVSNPEKQIAIVLRDESITKMLYDTLSILFDSLDSYATFNLNEYLEEVINK